VLATKKLIFLDIEKKYNGVVITSHSKKQN